MAAVLKLLIPGLGQIYKGKIGLGIVLLLVTVLGYALYILPGLLIHAKRPSRLSHGRLSNGR